MTKQSLGLVLGLSVLNGLASTASCTSKSTSHGAGGTDNTSSAGAGGSAGADSTDAAAGGSDVGGSTSMGGSIGTGTSTGGGTGGSVGTNGGSEGTTPVAMNCEADEPDCTCDDTGCYLVDGADCVQASACKSQNCGVTQDNDSVCCADACATNEVCAADGSGCEPAAACEDDQARCSGAGDYQLCEGGAWTTIEPCDDRGCSTELDGCLLGIGDGCDDDDECGEGTCQETPDGSSVCGDLSCGCTVPRRSGVIVPS